MRPETNQKGFIKMDIEQICILRSLAIAAIELAGITYIIFRKDIIHYLYSLVNRDFRKSYQNEKALEFINRGHDR